MRFERRKAFRIPLSHASTGQFRIGRDDYTATLLDQSASGFQIDIQAGSEITVGQYGLLRVGDDWYEVRVTRRERHPPKVRLGLVRTSDMIASNDLAAVAARIASAFPIQPKAMVRDMAFAGVLVAGTFGCAVWIAHELILGLFASKPNPAIARLQQAIWRREAGEPENEDSVSGPASRGAIIQTLFGLAVRAPVGYERFVREKVDFLAALSDPSIADELGLTAADREEMRQVLDACRQCLTSPNARNANGALSSEAMDALQTTHAHLRNLLPEATRRRIDQRIDAQAP
ncbi:MAG: PilZ domain-containing protein [Planctomycetes bacterium]|nr:PilZ domain-containing protein [Planctomycetota bacterium]